MHLGTIMAIVILITLGAVLVVDAATKSDSTQVIYYDFYTDDGMRCISMGTSSGGITCNWRDKHE